MCDSTTQFIASSTHDSVRCCWIVYCKITFNPLKALECIFKILNNLRFHFILSANNHGNERLTVTETKSTLPPADLNSAAAAASTTGGVPTTPREQTETESSLDLDSMYLMLEPNLRPATPDPNSRVSQQIFEEHKDLAREYLKVSLVIFV